MTVGGPPAGKKYLYIPLSKNTKGGRKLCMIAINNPGAFYDMTLTDANL
jgi:hypothetical protein